MRLPHNSLVLVADGRKRMLLRNVGDATHPNLSVEQHDAEDNPPHSDQATDQAGNASSVRMSGGAWGRGNMEEVDFQQQAEDRFAADTADTLNKYALEGAFDSLIVIAPPKTLGELRKHYHAEVSARLTAEISKTLTSHPIPEIEKLIAQQE